MRFFREHAGGRPFSELKTARRFYFVAVTVPCVSNKAAAQPADLMLMGHVAALEYYAVAHVMARTGRKPALNSLGGIIE
jgi:hypothetical protein